MAKSKRRITRVKRGLPCNSKKFHMKTSTCCVVCTKKTIPSTGNFEEQLIVVFFLKRFFKYSILLEEDEETYLQSLLQKNGNPANWIWFCPSCFESVKEAQNVYVLLAELELKLESLRDKIEMIVRQGFHKPLSLSSVDPLSMDENLFRSVRGAIYNHQNISSTPECFEDTNASSVFAERDIKVEFEDVEFDFDSFIPTLDNEEDHAEFKISTSPLIMDTTGDRGEGQDVNDGSIYSVEVGGKRKDSVSEISKLLLPDCISSVEEQLVSKGGGRGRRKSPLELRTCKVCLEVFEKPSRMTRHFISKHSKKLMATCNDCGKTFTSSDSLPKHKKYNCSFRNSKTSKKAKEDIKDNSTVNELSAEQGKQEEIGSEISSVPKVVKERLVSKTGKLHYSSKSPLELRTCKICSEVFEKPSRLKRHFFSKHSKTPMAKCDDCGKGFTRSEFLNKHKKYYCSFRNSKINKEKTEFEIIPSRANKDNVNDGSKNLFENDTSNYSAEEEEKHEKGDLKQRNSKTSSLESRTCKICNKVFENPSRVTRHYNSKHSKKPAAKCEDCGNQFSRKDFLPKHKKYHCLVRKGKKVKKAKPGKSLSEAQITKNNALFDNVLKIEATNQLKDDGNQNGVKNAESEMMAVPNRSQQIRVPNIRKKTYGSKSSVESRTCSVCHKVFEKPSLVTRHYFSRHSTVPAAKCDDCGSEFSRRDFVTKHKRDYCPFRKGENYVQIVQGLIGFSKNGPVNADLDTTLPNEKTNSDDVDNPIKTSDAQISDIKSRTCKVCNRIFDKPANLALHFRSQHINKGSFSCEVCNMKFTRKDFFDAHKKTHITNIKTCDDNDKSTNSNAASEYNENLRPRRYPPHTYKTGDSNDINSDASSDVDNRFDPDFCDNASSSSNATDDNDSDFELEHKSTKKQKSKTKYASDQPTIINKTEIEENVEGRTSSVCNVALVNSSLMGEHHNQNQKGEGNLPFNCDICGKGFKIRAFMKDHKLTHMNEEEKKQCQRWSYRKLCKERRMLDKEGGNIKEIRAKIAAERLSARTCPVCNKTFGRPSTMRTHLDGFHNRNRICICEICGMSFLYKWCLKRHLKFHMNGDIRPKPFKCTNKGCEKAYSDKRDLQSHELTHLDVKEFVCPLCGMSFPLKSTYEKHNLEMHSHLTSFKCYLCGKVYNSKHHLTRHMLKASHVGSAQRSTILSENGLSEGNEEFPIHQSVEHVDDKKCL